MRPRSNPSWSWKGRVIDSMTATRMAPAIRPNVSTIFFIRRFLRAVGRAGERPSICARYPGRASPERVILRPGLKITLSGDEPRLLGALDGLRPPPCRELAEEPRGVRLHGVLADEQPLRDL